MNSKPVRRLSFFQRQTFQIPEPEDKVHVNVLPVPLLIFIPYFHSTFPFQGGGQLVLDIIVENAGRVNYDTPMEVRKGEKRN